MMKMLRMRNTKEELKRFLSTLPPAIFAGTEVDRYCNPQNPSLAALQKIDLSPYTVRPQDDDAWLDMIDDLEKRETEEGNEFKPTVENAGQRRKTTRYYFSHPHSFLFLNVGSFHRDVYRDEDVLSLLECRLREKDFRFLVTSSHTVMKVDGHNPILERFLACPSKGLVIDMGERQPLHFLSVSYLKHSKYQTTTCFEYDHDESQVIRDRYFCKATASSIPLYLAQIQEVMKSGRLTESIHDYDAYTRPTPTRRRFFT